MHLPCLYTVEIIKRLDQKTITYFLIFILSSFFPPFIRVKVSGVDVEVGGDDDDDDSDGNSGLQNSIGVQDVCFGLCF